MAEEPGYGKGEYLCYQVLSRLIDRGINVSRTKFVKLPCMADRFLADELEHDPVVPRHWFKYGETIDVHSMRGDYYKSGRSNFFPGREYSIAKQLDIEDFDLSNADRESIDEAAKWAVTMHGKKNFRELRSIQYRTYAPREFIRAYGELRDIIEHFIGAENPTQFLLEQFDESIQSIDEAIQDKLDSMIISYPKEEYSEMYKVFLRWEDTTRLMLESEANLKNLNTFLDSFVKTLSEQILFYKYHSNITQERVNQWREIHTGDEEEFVDEINSIREDILVDRELSGEFEKISSTYSETVREDLVNH